MTVTILLPPSETKTTGTDTATLDVAGLSFPELTHHREQAIDALLTLCSKRAAAVRTALGITQRQEWEIQRNLEIRDAPTSPAFQVYTGVLYDCVGFDSLTSRAMKRLQKSTFVQSALFGLIGIADHIPAYRLSAGTTLPKIGTTTAHWSDVCSDVLANREGLIVDLRSGGYSAMGKISQSADVVTVRVLQRMPSGPPKVVTHFNKATKGRLLRAIALAPQMVTSADDVAQVAAGLGADVQWGIGKNASVLDVIVENVT